MNNRYYRNYKRDKQRWYFISYAIFWEDGKSGYGSTELLLSGKPDLRKVETYIREKNKVKNVILLNIVPTTKKRSKPYESNRE